MPLVLGQHELLIRLASGGAANVFLVRDIKKAGGGRLLALKVLLPNLAANEDFLNMFFSEARIAARLQHRNIVRIAGFGRSGNVHCLAMEYVFGASLAQVLRASARARKPLTVGVLLRITAQICDALHYAHEMRDAQRRPMGLVHRDVTPQNILIGFNGVPKLTDFGIAKATNRGWETQAGIVKGKFCYMSPEQALGKKVDRRSDIFCTGIVLWEALTGKELFKGTTPLEVLSAIREQKIIQPSKVVPGLSPIVDPIVMKALRRSPRQRYQSALEMRQDIEELITRAGVTIDAETISKEFAEIFGEQIVERAFALRSAMAGKADLEELSRALGGSRLNDEQLPDLGEADDYDEDPLGLFAGQAQPAFDDDGIEAALPAALDQPFTSASMHSIDDSVPPSESSSSIGGDDFEELSSMEFEEDASGAVEDAAIDEWSDQSKGMDEPDELLGMVSDDDLTIGMVPAEFTARFGNAIYSPVRDLSEPTQDEGEFGDEDTIDVSRMGDKGNGKFERTPPPPPPLSTGAIPVSIPADDTVLQPRASFDIQRAREAARSTRPIPRAPSLDMGDVATPLPEVDVAPTGRNLEPVPVAIEDMLIGPLAMDINPAEGLLDIPEAAPTIPYEDTDADRAGSGSQGGLASGVIRGLPADPEPLPLPPEALSVRPTSTPLAADEDAINALAAGKSIELSPQSLLQLAAADPAVISQPELSSNVQGPGPNPAAWAAQQSQQPWPAVAPGPPASPESGVRIRIFVLVLLGLALVVLGVAIGVFLVKFMS